MLALMMIRLAETREWSHLYEILFRMEQWKRLLLVQLSDPDRLPVPRNLKQSIVHSITLGDGKFVALGPSTDYSVPLPEGMAESSPEPGMSSDKVFAEYEKWATLTQPTHFQGSSMHMDRVAIMCQRGANLFYRARSLSPLGDELAAMPLLLKVETERMDFDNHLLRRENVVVSCRT